MLCDDVFTFDYFFDRLRVCEDFEIILRTPMLVHGGVL